MKPRSKIILAAICVPILLMIRHWGAQLGSVGMMIHIAVPWLISDDSWKRSLENDPGAHGYSGYRILDRRGSDIAVPLALTHLSSSDPYVWLNAAHYLGGQKRVEAVPYLIKALRHTAYKGNDERAAMLHDLTGESFGTDFNRWLQWYRHQPNHKELYWEGGLGFAPRIEKRRANNGPDRTGDPLRGSPAGQP